MTDRRFTTGADHAEVLDAADPLAPLRSEFAIPTGPDGEEQIYLVGHSLGALPRAARDHVGTELDRWGELGVRGHFEGELAWAPYHELLTGPMAAIVGAQPNEVVVMNSLTVNLHLLMVSFYRPTGQRPKILIEDHAFPSDHFAVESQIRHHGFDPAEALVRVSPRRGEQTLRSEDILASIEEHGPELALVLLPGVQYYTGQVLDIAAITEAGHAQGCPVGFDLAHAAGNLVLELHDWDVDFAAWCGYKYLNGGPGGVGAAFVHERHVTDRNLPKFLGWWGTDKSTRFEMRTEFEPIPTVESWQLSNAPVLAMAALRASLELFERAGGNDSAPGEGRAADPVPRLPPRCAARRSGRDADAPFDVRKGLPAHSSRHRGRPRRPVRPRCTGGGRSGLRLAVPGGDPGRSRAPLQLLRRHPPVRQPARRTDPVSGEPATVVGAGPAGSLMAICLAEQGRDVVVYESRPDMRRHDISAGRSINLALAARGIAALRGVGVMDEVDEITIPMRGRMVHTDGRQELQPYSSRPDEVIHSVSRRDLNAILLDAAEATGRVRIEFEQRCRGVDFGRNTITISDGSADDSVYEVEFDLLFGTDGASSVIRDAVLARNGGVCDEEPLAHGYKELTLPPDTDGWFQLDPNALHIWPRGEFMLIALANPEGDFTVTLFMPHDGPGACFEALREPEAVADLFEREFPDFEALVPDLTEQFFANPTGGLATIRTRGWSLDSRCVLVGDAAHAIVPFHGQGMNAAMESCRVLDRHMSAVDDLAEAFSAFEAERRPDTDAIADMALENYVEMRSGVVDPEYLIKRDLALELERRWPDTFIARYGMVMFTTMPYSRARRRAELQAGILEELVEGVGDVADVDFARAEVLVAELGPVPL